MPAHRQARSWAVPIGLLATAGALAAVTTFSFATVASAPERPAGLSVPAPVQVPKTVAPSPVEPAAVPAVATAPKPAAPAVAPKAVKPVQHRTPAKAKPAPAATPTQLPATATPPAYSEMKLDSGATVYCSNGYLQSDGTCTSSPGGYHPAPSAGCSGTGTECLNSMGGIENDIPILIGGR